MLKYQEKTVAFDALAPGDWIEWMALDGGCERARVERVCGDLIELGFGRCDMGRDQFDRIVSRVIHFANV